jgi:hypothetical protein
MSLKHPELPKAAVAVLNSKLPGLLARTAPKDMEDGGKIEVQPCLPIPIYSVAPDRILKEGLVNAAVRVGWRFILMQDKRPTVVADIMKLPDSGRLVVTNVSYDGAIAISQAWDTAEQFSSHQSVEYSPRILELPSLAVQTLWLHGHNVDREDAFIVFETFDGEEQPLDPVSYRKFTDEMIALSHQAAEFADVGA